MPSYEVTRGEAVEQKNRSTRLLKKVKGIFLVFARGKKIIQNLLNSSLSAINPSRYQEIHLALQSTFYPTFFLPAISFPVPALVVVFVVAPPGS